MVRRAGVACVVVVALLAARAAEAEDAPPPCGPALLVGGAFGLNGLGALPSPVLDFHAGVGWRWQRWMVAGLAAYSYSESEPLLAYWSIARHDVELVGVTTFRPLPAYGLRVHGQLGIGAALDQLHGVDPEKSRWAVTASFGAGAGWGPAALTFRYVIPRGELCEDGGRCFRAPAQFQLLLSLTLDLAALVRASR
jgi:hypothetical protein